MRLFLCFVCFSMVLFVQGYQFKKLEPQIKYLSARADFVNENYVGVPKYQITKKNETYNNIGLYWVVKKDLPQDIVIESKVYTTDAEGNNAKLILDDITPVCEESPNRHLSILIGIVDESLLGTQCYKKQVVHVKDMGQFRFEVLVPNLPKIGIYYKVTTIVNSPSRGWIFRAIFRAKWGYLK